MTIRIPCRWVRTSFRNALPGYLFANEWGETKWELDEYHTEEMAAVDAGNLPRFTAMNLMQKPMKRTGGRTYIFCVHALVGDIEVCHIFSFYTKTGFIQVYRVLCQAYHNKWATIGIKLGRELWSRYFIRQLLEKYKAAKARVDFSPGGIGAQEAREEWRKTLLLGEGHQIH